MSSPRAEYDTANTTRSNVDDGQSGNDNDNDTGTGTDGGDQSIDRVRPSSDKVRFVDRLQATAVSITKMCARATADPVNAYGQCVRVYAG